jgi:hypothetical protein
MGGEEPKEDKVLLDLVGIQDHLVKMEQMGSQVGRDKQEKLVYRGEMVELVVLVGVEQLDYQDLMVTKGLLVNQVIPGRPDRKESPDSVGNKEHLVMMALQVSLGVLERLVVLEKEAILDLKGLLESLVQLAIKVILERRDLLEIKEMLVQLVVAELLALVDRWEMLVIVVYKGNLEIKDILVLKVNLEVQGKLEGKVPKGHRENLVILDHRVMWVNLDRLDMLGQLVM